MEQVLAPSLKPGQSVVLDNLSAHTGERERQAIAVRECQVLWLPTYSPDLTPIEEAFSKLKAFLRRVAGLRIVAILLGRPLAWQAKRQYHEGQSF
jgi:transposase